MQERSYICNFIQQHPDDWRRLLSAKPYSLRIHQEGSLVIFNYAKKTKPSAFLDPLIQEARGIIIDTDTLEVACWPFRKFGNHMECYADSIDWDSARVQQKVDGNIMKLWHDGSRWRVSSNSQITPHDSEIPLGNLFWETAGKQGLDLGRLDEHSTYIFELTGPECRIVVNYSEISIWHIGTRNNLTGKERDEGIGIKKPKEYPLRTLDDCITAAKRLNADTPEGEPPDEEGFVVVDKDWHRVKVKSPVYVMAHLKLSFGPPPGDTKRAQIILAGEDSELLAYRPELAPLFEKTRNRLGRLRETIESESVHFRAVFADCGGNYMEFTERVKDEPWSSIAYQAVNGQDPDSIIGNMLKRALRRSLALANSDDKE